MTIKKNLNIKISNKIIYKALSERKSKEIDILLDYTTLLLL